MTIQAKIERVTEDVLAVLSEGEVRDNLFVFPRQLERGHYEATNTILERLGGKWNRKAKGHLFAHDPSEAIGAVIDSGTIENHDHLGYFQTPPELARTLVEMADVRPGHQCLEPSAGAGAIARELAAIVGWPNVTMVEIHEQRAEALERGFPEGHVTDWDFLEHRFEGFDRIVMNPPFARGQDILHVEHAFAVLEPGGVLVSVLADGVRFRKDRRATAFRALVDRHGEMERLPEGSFAASGTQVHTVVVRLTKPL